MILLTGPIRSASKPAQIWLRRKERRVSARAHRDAGRRKGKTHATNAHPKAGNYKGDCGCERVGVELRTHFDRVGLQGSFAVSAWGRKESEVGATTHSQVIKAGEEAEGAH